MVSLWFSITNLLDKLGTWLPQLPLRFILAWEFYESGIVKLEGSNWFGQIQENFPFPFNVIPADVSWFLATWTEVIGGICLALGLFTRFWSLSLIVLTVVAIAGVHWPDQWNSFAELWKGYAITDKGFGNFKLPLLFIVMLVPLLFSGPGKASLDHLLAGFFRR